MRIILLEKIRNVGSIGEQVNVKPGFARNFLIPHGKAISATKDNMVKFEARRAELEKAAAEALKAAQERAKPLMNLVITLTAETSEEGKLFGSIGMREIINALANLGHTVDKSEISLPEGPIHVVGEHEVTLLLHSDVNIPIKIKVVSNKVDEGSSTT